MSEIATVKVGLVIEIPIETDAETDDKFLETVYKNEDVNEAVSQLIFGALNYRDSSAKRKEHAIKYSKFIVFYDEETGCPLKVSWKGL